MNTISVTIYFFYIEKLTIYNCFKDSEYALKDLGRYIWIPGLLRIKSLCESTFIVSQNNNILELEALASGIKYEDEKVKESDVMSSQCKTALIFASQHYNQTYKSWGLHHDITMQVSSLRKSIQGHLILCQNTN